MGKPVVTQKPQPGLYRDDQEHDDVASTSSAVRLENIDYPDADLPAYEDVPASRLRLPNSEESPS